MNELRTDAIRSRYAGDSARPLDAHLPRSRSEAPAPFAGFWRRFTASLIDGILTGIAITILIELVGRIVLSADARTDGASLAAFVAWFGLVIACPIAIGWLYTAGMESSARQATIGKQMLGIVVTDLEGNRISFGRATGRYFARYLSLVAILIGYLIQPFTARRQALHDLIAGTVVVRHWPRVPAGYRPEYR